jgi:lycopene cyclase domain-containing protein
VDRLSYVAVLVGCLAATAWLEIAMRTRVLTRIRRLLTTIVIVMPAFILWDLYAISRGHWWFDNERILGVFLPGGLPLDEVLFFVTIPVVSVLTFEAVRSVKSSWPVADSADQP